MEGFLPHSDSMTAYKLLPVYEALWDADPDTRELRPMLAETLPQWSEDNKTLYITLRQGVQFHDGWGELTSEDVKFSIELAGRKGSVSASASDFAKANVEILGPTSWPYISPPLTGPGLFKMGARVVLLFP
ncbi:MAG: hypothetical protein HY673_10415 [Chloroflexi bacterium]|nr:hypothetical protein [Chloroflexota bacterium]